MEPWESCPLCKKGLKYKQEANSNIFHVECKICGEYKITLEELLNLKSSFEFEKYIISGVTRQSSEEGGCISIIDEKSIQQIIDSAQIPESPIEKMDSILLYIEKKASYEGDYVKINPYNDYPIAFAKNPDEMNHFLQILRDKLKYVENPGDGKFRLTVEGWRRISEVSKEKRDSNQAFVAMWFSEEMDDAWKNGFKPALKETGYRPIRIDKEEHIGKIDDAIVASIRKSGLLVADFTGMRSGVFFEAGFALGLGIPVIWTCNKSDFKKLHKHFDTRQYSHIEWDNPEDLKKKLINRIEANLPNRV